MLMIMTMVMMLMGDLCISVVGVPSASEPFAIVVNFHCTMADHFGFHGQIHAR